jgi:hypothetical protein
MRCIERRQNYPRNGQLDEMLFWALQLPSSPLILEKAHIDEMVGRIAELVQTVE